MGRKSVKSKIRASMKKEEKLRIDLAYESVKKAQQIENPLADFSVFQRFEKNDLVVTLQCKRVQDLDKDTLEWILKLEKENMEKLYDECSWGWDDKKKQTEMTDKAANYLIGRKEDGTPVAFSHYRFDMDHGDEVLYCYELQLDESVRRIGLGKFMLQALELMAFKNNMRKVVLTVLKHNIPAVNFFYSMRYTTDATNPVENLYENIPYEILSKVNKKLPPYGLEG